MLEFGIVAFAQPWLLLAMASLPLLWWLLRLTPPAPRRLSFPALRLLTGLRPPEETPARTPLWLILLRILILILIILGLAQPVLNPARPLPGTGPLLIVVDDGWAAARNWQARVQAMESLIDQAERDSRTVVVLPTAPQGAEIAVKASERLSPGQARRLARALTPQPWPVDRAGAMAALDAIELDGSSPVAWLSDGLTHGQSTEVLERFLTRLRAVGPLEVLLEPAPVLARRILAPDATTKTLSVAVERAGDQGSETAVVRATAENGRLLGESEARFVDGERQASASFDLPSALRNEIARLSIEGESSAGAVFMVDERWRRRPVGLVAEGPLALRPLLGEAYYLQRALTPYTEVHQGTVTQLLAQRVAILVLADVGDMPAEESDAIAAWVDRGGTLLRFAGPRLAQGADSLLPVRLRFGDRTLGGAMTWGQPARLAPFHRASPFADLEVPDDVFVERQVLAEPSLDLGAKTWARLEDGTPLVTAERRGKGWVVLVHTTANTDWSNLSLSGLFVEMLREIVSVSQGVADSDAGEPLPPIETLDGFGRLRSPPATALALDAKAAAEGRLDPRHPPGIYGRDSLRRAHNLSDQVAAPRVLGAFTAGLNLRSFEAQGETPLGPWLLAAALVLASLDLVLALALRGMLKPARVGRAAPLVILLSVAWSETQAQTSNDGFALEATTETRLAYVITGVRAVDDVSRAGLTGLSRVLNRRTAVEAAAPLGVRLGRDELAFFSLLYWPVTAEQRPLDEAAVRQVDAYMKNGGTILFDLRKPGAGTNLIRGSGGSAALLTLTKDLTIPPLVPVPPDHVLTKAFYLLQDFPGRFTGGVLWIESAQGRVNDGVSSVIIGANDWASAWALDASGRPMFATVPGGERQREMAYRFGVNLVMYALTGNYKTDQVHVPYILERLGQ